MKVTKLIREYVERAVYAMPQFANPTPEEIEYEAFQQKIADFTKKVTNEMHQSIQKAIDDFCMVNNAGADITIRPIDRNMVYYSLYGSELFEKAVAAEGKRKKACQEAVNKILVNLELGSTREELDEMLKKLTE